uniref:TIL domain-containing protein n=1 Tax=Anopheles christyi TaxID=43041 RepID=A0A182KAG4_9DIPT
MARQVLALLVLIGCVAAITLAEKSAGDDVQIETGPSTAEHSNSNTTEPNTMEPSTTTTSEPDVEEEELPPPKVVCTDPREVYNECGSSCDDRTCENMRRGDIQCTKQCVEGCFCRTGYANSSGQRICSESRRVTKDNG